MNTFRTGTLAAAFALALGVAPSFAQSSTPFLYQPVLPQAPRGSAPVVPVTPQPAAGPQLRGISVVLVEGDLNAVTANASLPAAAAKALADMKDFLPYKGYRVLDTQWTLGSGKIAVRLRGPAGAEYDLELMSSYMDPTRRARAQQLVDKGLVAQAIVAETPSGVSISEFRLREATRPVRGVQQGQGQSQGATASAQRSSESTAEIDRRVLADRYFFELAGSPALIETAFRMDVGETVVVGTSRLQGDKALIVLLTAVGK